MLLSVCSFTFLISSSHRLWALGLKMSRVRLKEACHLPFWCVATNYNWFFLMVKAGYCTQPISLSYAFVLKWILPLFLSSALIFVQNKERLWEFCCGSCSRMLWNFRNPFCDNMSPKFWSTRLPNLTPRIPKRFVWVSSCNNDSVVERYVL